MASKISRLRYLLERFPSTLPVGSATEYPFKEFQPDAQLLTDEGLAPAVAKIFENSFGWDSNGIPIKARGPHVIAAVKILEDYLVHPDCRDNCAVLEEWVNRLIENAQATYEHLAMEV